MVAGCRGRGDRRSDRGVLPERLDEPRKAAELTFHRKAAQQRRQAAVVTLLANLSGTGLEELRRHSTARQWLVALAAATGAENKEVAANSSSTFRLAVPPLKFLLHRALRRDSGAVPVPVQRRTLHARSAR
jgi:hypothetical protein